MPTKTEEISNDLIMTILNIAHDVVKTNYRDKGPMAKGNVDEESNLMAKEITKVYLDIMHGIFEDTK